LDRQTIDHIARLARLGVQDPDRSRYEGQLAAILQHFEQLRQSEASAEQRVESDSVERAAVSTDASGKGDAHADSTREGLPLRSSGRLRPDEVSTDGDGVHIVALAAEREDRSFRVPRVLE